MRTDWVADHDFGKVVYEVNFQLRPETTQPRPAKFGFRGSSAVCRLYCGGGADMD